MLPIIRREANRWSVKKKNSQFGVTAKSNLSGRRPGGCYMPLILCMWSI
jgi:hypothetical protein